jgi:hypothetical protein
MLRDTNRGSFDSSQLTLAQARFVIDRAVADGKLSAGDLQRYHSSINGHIQDLHRQIAALTESGRSVPQARRPRKQRVKRGRGRKAAAAAAEPASDSGSTGSEGSTASAGTGRRKRAPLTITPERREMMRIQGQFLSCRRRLPVREQKRFTEAYKAARSPEEKAKIVRRMVSTLK